MVDTEARPTPAELDRLRSTFEGEIVVPGHTGYEAARKVWNGRFDRRPAVVVRPRNAAAVATAINFGRDHGLELAIRAGGHSAAGQSTCDGGLVIDLAAMRGVTVDPARRLAHANGGALLGELDVAAQAHGLICPVGVIGHTGVAGLTLGGGVGRLQRRFGLTLDHLRAVELVTADGRIVRASETEEPELFWGVRGAGWNYGVVTDFELGLDEFGPLLHRGVLIYPGAQIHEVWSTFRDYAETAPDAVSAILAISRAEPASDYPASVAGGPIVVLAYNHSGRAEDVERDTAALRRGPEPASVNEGSQPYLEVQTAHDNLMGWGGRTFIQGLYATDIRPAALDALVEHAGRGIDGSSFSITLQGGAIGRVADDAMAFTGRTARFDLSGDATWTDPADDEAGEAWVRAAMAIVEPEAIEGRYANENSDVGPVETRRIYGEATMARLTTLKRTWDPDNVFHLNHNVAP